MAKFKLKTVEDIPAIKAGSVITISVDNAESIESQGTPLMWFKRGDVQRVEFESRVANSEHLSGRKARTSQFRHSLPVGAVGVSRSSVVPEFDDDGNMVAIRDSKTADNHVMFKPYVRGKLSDGSFFELDKTYRIVLRSRPMNFQSWPMANADGFVMSYQAWGPSYPRNVSWKSPPVFLRWYKGEWQCGLNAGNPHETPRKETFSASFLDEWSTWDITYRPSYQAGLFTVEKDGELLGRVAGGSTTVEHGKRVGPLSFFGAYSWNKQLPGVGFKYSDILIESLS